MNNFNEWNLIELAEVGSTNDEIKKYCQQPKQKTVIRANSQTAGRGRRGRSWITKDGNLFFSLALEFPLKNLGHLVSVSALSLALSIQKLNPAADVKLKWPNDVLLNDAKVSGILLEKGEGEYIIIGIGVNIVDSPKDSELIYKSTSLAEEGISSTREDFLQIYMQIFEKNLLELKEYGFALLREKWLKLAKNIGKNIIIKQNEKEEKGVFVGIDENANLLLQNPEKIKKILVGDVFYDEK